MNAIHSILVVVDPTAEVHSAVAKGALLAEAFRARLELYICDTKAARAARFAAHVSQSPKEPFVSDMKAVLEKLAGPLRARGLDVTTETECADPLHAALIQRTKHTSADLVVKDTHHHSLARRTFLTNTDWELIRNCAVPLLLTRTAAWTAHPRIVAAIDPGHTNDKPLLLDHRILEHAAALARHLGGELHAAHAYLPLSIIAEATTASPPMVMAVPPEILAAEERDKLKEVSALVSDYGIAPSDVHVSVGGPTELLPRFATSLRADIVAMGAISRSGLKRIVLGSTAEDVLERLPCDVLVVKPPDFADDLPF